MKVATTLIFPICIVMAVLTGEVYAQAKKLGIYEETYFVFCADNGTAVTAKDRGVERGVHVPYVVKGPSVLDVKTGPQMA